MESEADDGVGGGDAVGRGGACGDSRFVGVLGGDAFGVGTVSRSGGEAIRLGGAGSGTGGRTVHNEPPWVVRKIRRGFFSGPLALLLLCTTCQTTLVS